MKVWRPLEDWEAKLIKEYSDPKLYQGELKRRSNIGSNRRRKAGVPAQIHGAQEV